MVLVQKAFKMIPAGTTSYYGVREFGMNPASEWCVLARWLYRTTGAISWCSLEITHVNAVRMSALMGIQNVFVYTHDSIGQGERWANRISLLINWANLRMTPNMIVCVSWWCCRKLQWLEKQRWRASWRSNVIWSPLAQVTSSSTWCWTVAKMSARRFMFFRIALVRQILFWSQTRLRNRF